MFGTLSQTGRWCDVSWMNTIYVESSLSGLEYENKHKEKAISHKVEGYHVVNVTSSYSINEYENFPDFKK